MVFQSYAIWPHMDVFDNVAFPLTQGKGKLPKAEVKDRVMEALALVRLDGLERRPAPQLSGGQQQRLALARALVRQPKALLLDEPLSNLDAKLRDDMRVELKMLTERLEITTLFVTHDQLEALTLSDQIAVMRDGEIVQLGGPKDIYDDPNSRFTAEFIGTTNLLEGTITSHEGNVMHVETPQGMLRCDAVEALSVGDKAAVAIRPANIVVSAERQPADNVIEGSGGDTRLPGRLAGLPHRRGRRAAARVHPRSAAHRQRRPRLSHDGRAGLPPAPSGGRVRRGGGGRLGRPHRCTGPAKRGVAPHPPYGPVSVAV